MDLSLANSAYIVTGGTSGLGLATAQALISEGAHVLVSSRSQEKVDAAVAELGDGSHGIALDNASPEAPATLFRTAAEAFDAGIEPRDIWTAICEATGVPPERRLGRDTPRAAPF